MRGVISMRTISRETLCLICCALIPLSAAADSNIVAANSAASETVMVTYHVRYGQEAALARVISRHWATARKLNLVHRVPHLLLQGTENSKLYFVEVFTWRDGSIPDNAPDEIRNLWVEMSQLVEPRDGHQGIDISQVSPLPP
jgi:hypothetical protein